MKTELHLKLISIIIAFSFLFLALYNAKPILATTLRIILSLIIILYFITIWMRAKKFTHFASSMLLPIWLLVLINPEKITDYLFVLEKGNEIKVITEFIQSDASYKKLTHYSILDKKNFNSTYSVNAGTEIFFSEDLNEKWYEITSSYLANLLRKNYLTGFQLGHNSILFYIHHDRHIRYYFDEKPFIYQGDQQIKSQWYRVHQ